MLVRDAMRCDSRAKTGKHGVASARVETGASAGIRWGGDADKGTTNGFKLAGNKVPETLK